MGLLACSQFRGRIYRLTEAEGALHYPAVPTPSPSSLPGMNRANKLVAGDVIILPMQYLEELRKIPDASVSNEFAVKEIMQHKYTGLSIEDPLMNHVIRSDLTHKLPQLLETLSSEVTQTVHEYLGKDREWKSTNITNALLPMISVISGRIFLGPELNRRKEYLHASINYTVDAFAATNAIRGWPQWLRPIVKFFIPEIDKIAEHRRLARDFLLPVITERQAQMTAGDTEMPDDMLQWMMAKAEKFNSNDPEKLVEIQLILSVAAIHTTTMMATFTYVPDDLAV